MRVFTFFFVLLVVFLSGCASTKEPNSEYAAYIEFKQAEEKNRQLERQQYAAIAQTCSTESCVQTALLTLALVDVATRGGQGQASQSIQPFQPRPSYLEIFGLGFLKVLPALAGSYVSLKQSDNAVRTSELQYGFLNGVISDVTGVVSDVTGVVGDMQPNVTVGGNYITGDGNLGGNATGDGAGIGNMYSSEDVFNSGDGNAIGDGNDVDNSQGQVNGDGNRFESPDFNSSCNGAPGAAGAVGTGNTGAGSGVGGSGGDGGSGGRCDAGGGG